MTEQKLIPKKISDSSKDEPFIIDDADSSSSHLKPSTTKEDLSIIKGIGRHVTTLLQRQGITNIQQLAQSTPQSLASIHGIGLQKAQTLIKNAKSHLQNKRLNGFPISELENIEDEIEEPKVIEEPEVYEIENSMSVGDIADLEDTIEEEPDFEVEDIEEEIVSQEKVQIESTVQKPEPISPEPEIDIDHTEDTTTLGEEEISSEEFRQLEDTTRIKLQKSGFQVIEHTSKLQDVVENIDLLAIKHISEEDRKKKGVNKNDLLLIIPIKISPLEGSLIVSEEKIGYDALDKANDFYVKRLPMSYLEEIGRAEQNIRSNLSQKGTLFALLNKNLDIPLTLVRSFNKKKLYYLFGKNQCEILVNPVILSKNTVGFTEKVLPYAYHKNTNVHILKVSKFSELLIYLERKYVLLKSSINKKSLKELHYTAEEKLQHHILPTVGLLGLGIIYAMIFIFQTYSILRVVNQFAIGLIVVLVLIYGYIIRKYHKQVSEISQVFSTPYLKRELNIDNTTLKLINQDLTPSLMEQFSYECLGKNPQFKILHKVEQQNSESFLQERALKKKVKQTNLFEEEEQIEVKKSIENSEISARKKEIREKYSSFVED